MILRLASGCLLLAAALAGPARAHLLVTEVGYDPVDETVPTAEFIEVYNPGPLPAPLGSVWVTDEENAYPNLVNGPVSPVTSTDFVYRLPGVTLAPGGVVVICADSDAFLAEFFPITGLAGFLGQSGSPMLVEATQDGGADGVPDVVSYGSNPAGNLQMSNNGECAGLTEWDEASDLVKDHDWVCWLTNSAIPDKDFDFILGIDGPDPDLESSFFAEDDASGPPAPDSPQGGSIHRTSLSEPGERLTSGNGVTGHDETSENWSSWQIAPYSPGVTTLSSVDVVPDPASVTSLRLWFGASHPARGDVTLAYALPRAGWTRLTVHDVTGRAVARLVDRFEPQGRHTVRWSRSARDGLTARGGLYFVHLHHQGETAVLKVALLD